LYLFNALNPVIVSLKTLAMQDSGCKGTANQAKNQKNKRFFIFFLNNGNLLGKKK